jgi:tetratricopeptide (TPR) repeat protein
MLWCGSAWAQAPPPEELYQSGALRAAAVGFERRTELEPASAAHWYNLGATHYRLGDRGDAMAAWLRARRLAPRDPTILRALRLTPSPDATSARWTWSAPATPDELIVVAAIGWLLGWGGWMLRPQYRARWMVLLIVAAMFGLSSLGVAAWYRRPIAIVLDQIPLRLSPHGRAPAVAPLEAGSAVRVLRQQRGWVLVRGSQSTEGWLPSDDIAAIHG